MPEHAAFNPVDLPAHIDTILVTALSLGVVVGSLVGVVVTYGRQRIRSRSR